MMITENFLHFVWQSQSFSETQLVTHSGDTLKVIHPGYPHHNAGPDFKEAILQINGLIWSGDVEIHIKSSDWLRHRHQNDEKYNSVILHVVYQHDIDIYYQHDEKIVTFVLENIIPETIMDNYYAFLSSSTTVRCADYLKERSSELIDNYLHRLAHERLLIKQKELQEILKRYHYDWYELLFHLLTINFGFKANNVAFELLAKSLPYKHILECSCAKLQTYALIFGQAGMLDEDIEADDYYQNLQMEYYYLRNKFRLTPIHVKNWNLLRLRPSNFPCIRLAQLSEVIHYAPELFYAILTNANLAQIEAFFQRVPHGYWNTHYQFGKKSKKHSCQLGRSAWQLIVINTIVPVLYAYGTHLGNNVYQEKAIELLKAFPFEHNFISSKMKNSGFPAESALFSQGLLHLSKEYCTKNRCLECMIGRDIINDGVIDPSPTEASPS